MGINEWKTVEIDAVANVIDPHPSHRAPKEVENGIPFVGIGDIDENGNINRESARVVSDSVFDEHRQRYDLSKPLIGIGRVASLGKVIKLRNDLGRYAVSPTMAVLDFYGLDPSFAYYYMCSTDFQKQFSGSSNGSTRQSVGMQYIRKLYIRYPSYEEQKRIADSMLDLDKLIETIQKSIVKKMNVFTGVLQNIEKKHLNSRANKWPIVDINADTTKSSSDDVYNWLVENAHTYGFIKRYPSNKTDITGVINEPWHYRYVGKEAALEIYSQGICLEEYIDMLE